MTSAVQRLECRKYVLLTAARNEEAFIEKTLHSVAAQTILPTKWVIVSNGSTDRTEQIARAHEQDLSFIEVLSLPGTLERGCIQKVHALEAGFQRLRGLDYDFIGNVDSDVSFDPTYFAQLLSLFENEPRLGIVGGAIWEERHGSFRPRKGNSVRSVPHAVQFLRRECYEGIGGFRALPYGGEDWYAEVTARMLGWQVRSFEKVTVYHHRPTGTANGLLRGRFHNGALAYSLGSDPFFELLKYLSRVSEVPYVIGSCLSLAGFVWSYFSGKERSAPKEFIAFLRREQRQRLLRSTGLSILAGSHVWSWKTKSRRIASDK